MHSVNNITSNKHCKNILKQSLIDELKNQLNESLLNSICNVVSNSFIGIIIEQYILLNQYNNKNKSIAYVVDGYLDILNEIQNNIKVSIPKHDKSNLYSINFKANWLYLYLSNDLPKLEDLNCYMIDYYLKKLKQVDSVHLFNFTEKLRKYTFIKYDNTILAQRNQVDKICLDIIKELKSKLYSKKKVNPLSQIKYLYLQQILIGIPFYFLNGSTKFSYNRFINLFLDYKKDLDSIECLIKCNIQNIEQIGEIKHYQYPCRHLGIHGRIDFVTHDSFIEIKTGKPNFTNDYYQILLYTILAKESGEINNLEIKYIKIFYLSHAKLIQLNIEDVLKSINCSSVDLLKSLNRALN